ncbi:hypothetical protein M8Z33_29785 [Streptomyces sp. ZAF1911]|uniref:hypothetical protein n=1 Tax=unclassified Streptomyces TaxID=2593676 RepID=UPI00237B7B35|nr:hypothetical protein [Streptomyces sp. ZAF1911]MDD9380769.1 hypothetical protein [Streptomyces sp. ZAF1911]
MDQQGREALIAGVSELAVLRALQLAGNRIVGKRGRSVRGPMRTVDPWSVHVHLRVESHELDDLLDEAWQIPAAAGLPDELLAALDGHARTLLAAGIEFRRDDLKLTLSRLPRELVLPWEPQGSAENRRVAQQ